MDFGRISVSQAQAAQRCMAMHYFRYCLGIKTPPSGAMLVGTSVDRAAGAFLINRIEKEKDLSPAQVMEKAAQVLEEQWDQVEQPKEWKDLPTAKDKVKNAIPTFYKDSLEESEPLQAQEEIKLDLTEELSMIGYIDELESDLLTDYKAVSKRKSEGWAISEQQDKAYAAWAMLALGQRDSFVTRYDVLVIKKVPEVQRIETVVTPEMANYTLNWLQMMSDQIKLAYQFQVFPPNRQHMFCSRRGCGYWQECEKRYGGKVRP